MWCTVWIVWQWCSIIQSSKKCWQCIMPASWQPTSTQWSVSLYFQLPRPLYLSFMHNSIQHYKWIQLLISDFSLLSYSAFITVSAFSAVFKRRVTGSNPTKWWQNFLAQILHSVFLYTRHIKKHCHQKRFQASKYPQNAFAARLHS